MDNKYLTIIIIILIMGLGVIAYIWIGQPITNNNNNNNKIKNKTNVSNSQQNITVNKFVKANNLFASDLYNEYKSEDGNIFFSPYSISSALSMTYEGAKGETAKEMKNVLDIPKKKEELRSDFSEVYDRLNKGDKSYNLTTANALWAQEDFPFVDEYFNVVDEYYDGEANNMDFANKPEESKIEINNWVENKTNGKIEDIIDRLSSATTLVLTNAIYFKANWSNQFNVEDTKNKSFELMSGEEIETEMMHQTSDYNYSEIEDLQILEMDYLENDLSMLIILPKNNKLEKVEDDFSKDKLEEWKSNMQTEKVQVILPKFKFETKYSMAEDLKEMGMPTAFNTGADFTGMSPTGELFISRVIHQTFIEVAEYGTEAAAATAVIMEKSTQPQEDPKIFRADHPFIFLIQEKDSGNILFMGRMSDPTQE